MDRASSALIGTVVQKERIGSVTYPDVPNAWRAAGAVFPPAGSVFGRVVNAVSSSNCEFLYHVVYEDGSEAYLPEDEVCSWLVAQAAGSSCGNSSRSLTPTPSTPGGANVFRQVLGNAPTPRRCESAFDNVYGDPAERHLLESERRLWEAACGQFSPTVFSTTTARPQISTTTRRSSGSMIPIGTTATSLQHDFQNVYHTSCAIPASRATPVRPDFTTGPLMQWGRRHFSQGPTPPSQHALTRRAVPRAGANTHQSRGASGSLEACTRGQDFAEGLSALIFTLLLAFFVKKIVELSGSG